MEFDYDALQADSDSEWITLTLGVPNVLSQRYPLDKYSYSLCPEATPSRFKGPVCQYTGGDTTCTGSFEDCKTKGHEAYWGGELGLDPDVRGI